MPALLNGSRLLAAALLVACATSAIAQTAAPVHRPAAWKPPARLIARPSAQPAAFLPGAAGMIITIDPETGALSMPTRAQAAQLSLAEENMLSRSTEGLAAQYFADGTIMLDLQGRFQEFSFARVGEGGRIVHECFSDPNAVRRALVTPLPKPAVLEDR